MPIFEYTCSQCDSQFELLVRGQEKPACPECGSKRLEKLLSVPAAHTAGGKSLPISSEAGNCGRPQCGGGRCGFGG